MNTNNLLIITLHADPAMPPGVNEWGGTHTYMRELLTELADSNYNIVLVTRKVYPNELDIENVIPNGKILRLTLGSFENFDKRCLYGLHDATLQQLIKRLSSINFVPDIVHSVYWNSGHIALKLSRLWNIPYVHSVISNAIGRNAHGASGTASHRIEVEKQVFEQATFIICVAESEKQEISQYYTIKSEKIIVAGQYVHPSFFYASHNEYGHPRKSSINHKIEPIYFPVGFVSSQEESTWWNKQAFSYVGRLSVDKGLDCIIETWFLLYQKYFESCPPLWVVGGSPDDIRIFRKQLHLPLNELELLENSGKLIWWGYLDENGISALYTRTIVLITHSRYEPGGRVAVEAMCEGVPVIATPNGFAMDVIKNWSNGFLVSYRNTKELLLRMEHFVKQPYLSNILGEKAKNTGHQIVSNWDFKNKHIAVYQAALSPIALDVITTNDNATTQISSERMLRTYPYNQILVDDTDILQILEANQIANILSVKKIILPDASSLFWTIQTKTEDLFIKIPYDRINNSALWAPKGEQGLVVSGAKRYRAELQALQFNEIPYIIGKDDSRNALIRQKYASNDIPGDAQLKNTVNSIMNFYKNDIGFLSDLFVEITHALERGTEYQKIDQLYQDRVSQFLPEQYYYYDYSLRVELLRWKNYYENLPVYAKKKIESMWENFFEWTLNASEMETQLKPTLIHGGCDFKNLVFIPKTIFLDNECIHPGFPGIDFADLLITYVRKTKIQESLDLWRYLFSFLPQGFMQEKLIAAWIALDTYKEAISDAAQLKPVNPALEKRLQIMQQMF